MGAHLFRNVFDLFCFYFFSVISPRGEFWDNETSLIRPYLCKFMYQARKLTNHLFVLGVSIFASFYDFDI